MFMTSLTLAALAAPAACPPNARCDELVARKAVDHGKLSWFKGSWEELLAKAKSEKKIVFLDFFTRW